MEIYLDNASTTKVKDEVIKSMQVYQTDNYSNPSSIHSQGEKAKQALEKARKIIADKMNARPNEIIFTSGATESNNLALRGIANYYKKGHIITTKIEHASILETCKELEKQGFKISYLDVDQEGYIGLKDLENNITKETILISVIHANNEIGTIQDLNKISEIASKHKIKFHTDAAQSFCKLAIDSKNIDLISLNSHKIHGPKGIGALYIKTGTKLSPQITGGGQESNIRSGTENLPGIIGFAKAVELFTDIDQIQKFQIYFIDELLTIPGTKLNGPITRLCNNINLQFPKLESDSLLLKLDKQGIYTSTGSACSSKKPSHVLKAIGLTDKQIKHSLRLSLSVFNNKEQIDYTIKKIKEILSS